MRELARPSAGAGGEVVLLDQRDGQAPGRRVERDTRAGHAAADDENVDDVFPQRGQLLDPPLRCEVRVTGHGFSAPSMSRSSSASTSPLPTSWSSRTDTTKGVTISTSAVAIASR